MATRKKYKIVLSEKYVRKSENGKEWFQFPVDVSGQLVAIQTIIPLDPYIEPDLEQIRKEAYAEGFKDGQYAERAGLVANYAQEQETIQVGDEVTLKCGVRPAIYMQGTKGSDEIYLLFNDGSCGQHSKSEIERKTGRHFHEIATILEKMRGEQDG